MYGQEPSSSLLHFSDINTFNFNSFNISLFLFLPVSLVSISQPPKFQTRQCWKEGRTGTRAGMGCSTSSVLRSTGCQHWEGQGCAQILGQFL